MQEKCREVKERKEGEVRERGEKSKEKGEYAGNNEELKKRRKKRGEVREMGGGGI